MQFLHYKERSDPTAQSQFVSNNKVNSAVQCEVLMSEKFNEEKSKEFRESLNRRILERRRASTEGTPTSSQGSFIEQQSFDRSGFQCSPLNTPRRSPTLRILSYEYEDISPEKNSRIFTSANLSQELISNESTSTQEGSFHLVLPIPTGKLTLRKSQLGDLTETLEISSDESESSADTLFGDNNPGSNREEETTSTEMDQLLSKLNALEKKLEEQGKKLNEQGTTIDAQAQKLVTAEAAIAYHKEQIKGQEETILVLSQRGPGGSSTSSVRKAVYDLDKCTASNVSSFIMGVRVIASEFEKIPNSEKLILQYAKLRIDDLDGYHTKDFESIDQMEEVLLTQLKKIRNVESIETELRTLHMSFDKLDEYVKRVRALMSQHYMATTDDYKTNNIVPTPEMRQMNELKLVRYFVAGLSNEIRYRIYSNHKTIDDAVREAQMLNDEAKLQRSKKRENEHRGSPSKPSKHGQRSNHKHDKKSSSKSTHFSPNHKKSSDVKCHNCGIRGHTSNVCRKPKQEQSEKPKNFN